MRTKKLVVVLAGLIVLGVSGSAGAANPVLEALPGVTQNWDKVLPANDPGGACPNNSSRFTCVMGGAAVRDNETGLVWEQAPATTTLSWLLARFQCAGRTVGGRKGWRLPSVHELASLADPSVDVAFPDVTLPEGHPFSNVQSAPYWSASSNAVDPTTSAWVVSFFPGSLVSIGFKDSTFLVWCVRGALNADQY